MNGEDRLTVFASTRFAATKKHKRYGRLD